MRSGTIQRPAASVGRPRQSPWVTRVMVAMCALPAMLSAQSASAGSNRSLDALPWRGELSMVKAAIPLAAGLLVLDGDEIHLIRPDGADSKVVREGDGPLELRKPTALLPYRGDSVLAVGSDPSVVLVLTPAGAPARKMPQRDVRNMLMVPRGSSLAGAVGYMVPRFGQQLVDSAEVVLVDPDRKQSRRVTTLWHPGMSTSGKLSRNFGKPTDEALLTGSGVLVVYRVAGQRLELFDATGARTRQLTLSGRPRERTAAEQKQMRAAAAMAKARMDSMVQQMDPKVRAMMAEITSATTGNLSSGRCAGLRAGESGGAVGGAGGNDSVAGAWRVRGPLRLGERPHRGDGELHAAGGDAGGRCRTPWGRAHACHHAGRGDAGRNSVTGNIAIHTVKKEALC